MVSWTSFPAIHWFTYPWLRRTLKELGLEPFDRLDVLKPEELTGLKAVGRGLLAHNGAPPPARPLDWFLVNRTSLYARRPITP